MKKNFLPFLLSALLLITTLTACAGAAAASSATGPDTAAESAPGSVTAEGKLLPAPAVELAFAQGGVVAEVLVRPGQVVAAGDVLARLVGIKTVQAELVAAQARYDQTYSAALAQDQPNRSRDLYKTQPGDFTLPMWYYDQQEQISAAQVAVDEAQGELTKAQEKLANKMKTTGADFVKTETDLAAAQAIYEVAKNLNDRIQGGKDIDDLNRRQLYLMQMDLALRARGRDPKWGGLVNGIDKDLRDEAQKIFDDAESTLKDAQDAYDDAASTDGAKDVQKAHAQVSIAQERYYTALDYVRVLQTGSQAQTVTAAMTALDKAKAALEFYELRAPFGGTVLSFNLSAGEAAIPGSPVAFLADTATWTVETKDLAELDIARVALGQNVTVELEALPGQEFPGKVTAIDPVGKEYSGDMTYKVTVTLDRVDPRFMWNMTATVEIEAK